MVDRVICVVPDIVDDNDDIERSKRLISRNEYSRKYRCSPKARVKYEQLAIRVLDYGGSIFQRDENQEIIYEVRAKKMLACKYPLSPYHVWVLEQIRQRFKKGSRLADVKRWLKHHSHTLSYQRYIESENAKSKRNRKKQHRRYYQKAAS